MPLPALLYYESITVETGWVCLVGIPSTRPKDVVIAWRTLFEPNISKYKPNITKSELFIMTFSLL